MTERKRRTDTRKSLVFLEALIAATPEELRDMNKAISAARAAIEARAHLPGGAEVVIAEALADPEIARMLELLEQKRKTPYFTGCREQKGMTREQIRATAQRKREQRRRSTAAAKIRPTPGKTPQPQP